MARYLAREKGCIKYAAPAGIRDSTEPGTFYVGIDFDGGGYQSFGGLTLPDKTTMDLFIDMLKQTFDVKSIDDLVGMECHALRPFDRWGTAICGIESPSGKRFTVNMFRKALGQTDLVTELQSEIRSYKSEIAYHERRIEEYKEKILKVEDDYVEWDLA